MKIRHRAATTVLSAVAVMGAVLVGVAGPAGAVAPPWEPDSTNQIGQLRFYNAAGTEVTTGNVNDDPFAVYAVATSDDPHTANTLATLYGYTPVSGVLPVNWSGEQLSGTTTFPVVDVGAPTVVKNAGAHRPVVTIGTTAGGVVNLAGYLADLPNTDVSTAYAGLYELRLKTAGNDPKFWAADISVSGSTWTVVYPQQVTQDPSSMTISANKTINYGASAITSTTLKDSTSNAVIAAAPVKLYKRAKTSAPWVFFADATTNASGVASRSVAPTGETLYQWRYAGTAGHATATSPTQTVSVKQTVAAHSTKSSVRHGVAFKIYGTVQPASSGRQVSLQRQAGTRWNSIGTATIKNQKLPDGSTAVGFLFTVKQATKGTFKYRVSKAATATLLAGVSTTLTVKVT
jgi:hypothetical protein